MKTCSDIGFTMLCTHHCRPWRSHQMGKYLSYCKLYSNSDIIQTCLSARHELAGLHMIHLWASNEYPDQTAMLQSPNPWVTCRRDLGMLLHTSWAQRPSLLAGPQENLLR